MHLTLAQVNAEIEDRRVILKRLQELQALNFKIEEMTNGTGESSVLPMLSQIVCEMRDVRLEDLKSKQRTQWISDSRFIVMFLARRHSQLPLQKIGEYFNRDHGTVTNGVGGAAKLLKTDKAFARDLGAVERLFLRKMEQERAAECKA